MAKEIISTERAPAAIGPYSQAVAAGGFVFLSGQIPIDPATRALVPGDVRKQTRQVLDNLKAVLTASGASLGDVVKTTIYLTNLADFTAVNEIYAETFGTEPPARATVGVAALPMGAKVEIDAIAVASRAP
jgi:2-iminobutanoate/2-iminopropanoate deaminase